MIYYIVQHVSVCSRHYSTKCEFLPTLPTNWRPHSFNICVIAFQSLRILRFANVVHYATVRQSYFSRDDERAFVACIIFICVYWPGKRWKCELKVGSSNSLPLCWTTTVIANKVFSTFLLFLSFAGRRGVYVVPGAFGHLGTLLQKSTHLQLCIFFSVWKYGSELISVSTQIRTEKVLVSAKVRVRFSSLNPTRVCATIFLPNHRDLPKLRRLFIIVYAMYIRRWTLCGFCTALPCTGYCNITKHKF